MSSFEWKELTMIAKKGVVAAAASAAAAAAEEEKTEFVERAAGWLVKEITGLPEGRPRLSPTAPVAVS